MGTAIIRRPARALLAVLSVALSAASGASASQATTIRASVSSFGKGADALSFQSSISADGRYVAFASEAGNLDPRDDRCKDEGEEPDGHCADIFVFDRATRKTAMVSVSAARRHANGASWAPSISGDGRYVAFFSDASNLVAGDTNGMLDVFVHDRRTRTTARVSVASRGEQAEGASYLPALSADGRFVSFQSDAPNLVRGDTNETDDVFAKDLRTGAVTRASVSSSGRQGNGASVSSSLSADGRYVAFTSWASNLVPGDTHRCESEDGESLTTRCVDVFVRDLVARTTTRVSVSSTRAQANDHSGFWSLRPAISGDGRYVAFDSFASNLVPGDDNSRTDVFVRDRKKGTTTLVSVSTAGVRGNAESSDPAISRDGRFIAFGSHASTLTAGEDPNVCPDPEYSNCGDVYVRDLALGTTTRVSVDSSGFGGLGGSVLPSISGDGRSVAFESDAAMVPGDGNGIGDIYVRDRGRACARGQRADGAVSRRIERVAAAAPQAGAAACEVLGTRGL